MGLPTNDLNALYQAHIAGGAALPQVRQPVSINIAVHTEDIAWAYHTVANTAAKSGTTKPALVDSRVVTLSEITGANVYARLSTNFTAAGLAPFVVGKPYLVSLYVWSPVDFWWHHRACPGASDYGQGSVQCRAGELTRVWFLAWAYSTANFDGGSAPTAALGAVNDGVGIVSINNNYGGTMAAGAAPCVGGLMIEPVPTGYRDGIALIGDSTFAGSSGSKDRFYDMNTAANREVSTVLGSELRCPVFNRAVGGERLDQMDARWASDISVLKHRCGAAVIQGGINDISQGRTLSQMQASVQSMAAKAAADGLRPYYANVTPFAAAAGDSAKETLRRQYNDWLASAYGEACADISSVVIDTGTGNSLSSAAYGDGTHYPGAAKTAIGIHMSRALDWSWRVTPGAYIKAAA